jgi:endonuclease/exonuclease/phosphatase family metal-dependent hydrolase
MSIKVVTFNIHKGFAALNREFTLAKLKAALRDLAPDVAFLQEVVGRHDGRARRTAEWPVEPQFEYLADSVWPHYAYGKNALYPAGHHGNAVLSKFPIVSWRNEDVSNHRLERRGILHCTVRVPRWEKDAHLLCVHLDLTERGRRRQLEKLVAHVRAHVPASDPLILAGDFNDWRRRASGVLYSELGLVEAHEALHGLPARTFPAALPLLSVDRVYCRRLAPLAARVLRGERWRRLSDHAPLAATLGPQ